MKAIKDGVRRLTIPGALAFASALLGLQVHAEQSSSRHYEAAAVHAAPGLECRLHSSHADAGEYIPVFTNDDGYARFYAVRPTAAGDDRRLTLDCTDAAGKSSRYEADLTASATFQQHPLDLSREHGIARPALSGDPQSYSQLQLIQQGYGVRPERDKAPEAYARWLAAATKPGRLLAAEHADPHSHGVTSMTAPWWAGSVLGGAANYDLTEAEFNVPSAIAGGAGTTTTEVAIWNGLGGFGTGSGLIQGGVNLYTTTSAAAYGTWREYCCGDPYSNGYGGAFTPSPGDEIFSEEWYCDASGNVNISGGYGCTYLYDFNSGATLSCTLSTGSPCWSVPAIAGMTFGRNAEFIIENQSPQVSSSSTAFTDFSPAVTMYGWGHSTSTGSWQTVSSDPSVYVLTDFTNTTSHLVVTQGSSNTTVFTMEASQPSYPLYCQGPLSTSGGSATSQTTFVWAGVGAGYAPPGPGQCAWADRGPRGSEIQSGNTNVLYGFLNGTANLPAGRYAEYGVYRDPNFGNDMMVTRIVGFVSPPFSSSASLP